MCKIRLSLTDCLKFYPRKCDLANEADIRSMFSWINSHPELGKVPWDEKLRKLEQYIRSMFASTMRVWAPRRHSGMAPWSLGELCWMSMYSVGNIKLCCRAYSKHHISSLSVHPAERWFHGLQQDWWWANHHDRVNVRTQGPSKPFNEANYRHIYVNLVIYKIGRFYAASKFAVTGLLEGWRQELRDIGGNIRVCGISPGAHPPTIQTLHCIDRVPIPGLVQTEFQAAMYPDSPDKVAAIHNSVPCLQSEVRKMKLDIVINIWLFLRTFPGQ